MSTSTPGHGSTLGAGEQGGGLKAPREPERKGKKAQPGDGRAARHHARAGLNVRTGGNRSRPSSVRCEVRSSSPQHRARNAVLMMKHLGLACLACSSPSSLRGRARVFLSPAAVTAAPPWGSSRGKSQPRFGHGRVSLAGCGELAGCTLRRRRDWAPQTFTPCSVGS